MLLYKNWFEVALSWVCLAQCVESAFLKFLYKINKFGSVQHLINWIETSPTHQFYIVYIAVYISSCKLAYTKYISYTTTTYLLSKHTYNLLQ